MGRRTLVVIPQSDGRFECRYAHWGVSTDPMAQSHRLGRDWSAAAVLEELDAGYERLLIADGRPRWYCVCWLDPTLTDPGDVALARTDDPDGLDRWWPEAKSRAVDAVAGGAVPVLVRAALLAALEHRTDAVRSPDDASFLRDGR